MFLHRDFVPGLAIYSYMVGDEISGRCAVIDPTREVEPYMRTAREQGLRITDILETHLHADFVSGAVELKARLPHEARIHCSGLGGAEWTPPYADATIGNEDEVSFGSLRLKALHTPGHTPEHVSWALFDRTRSDEVPWVLFTGDFLFVGDVGRPDLLGSEAQQRLAHELYQSVFERIADLPDFLELFPAYGAGSLCGKAIGSRESSTLGFERRFNPSLRRLAEDEWVAALLRGMPVAPPYFRRMKEVNSAGPRVVGPELPGRKGYTAKEVHERVCADCLILDVRPKEAFAAAHVPGSINIPFGPHLATWAGWVLPYERPVLAVVDDPQEMTEIARCLLWVGFEQIEGYLEGGVDAWEGQATSSPAWRRSRSTTWRGGCRRARGPSSSTCGPSRSGRAATSRGRTTSTAGCCRTASVRCQGTGRWPRSAAAAIAPRSRLRSSSARGVRGAEQRDRRHDRLDQRWPSRLPLDHECRTRERTMAVWLVTASWSDDEAELTQQWEVNVPTEDEAVREVTMLLPSRPHHVEAKLLAESPATDLGPGQARRLQ